NLIHLKNGYACFIHTVPALRIHSAMTGSGISQKQEKSLRLKHGLRVWQRMFRFPVYGRCSIHAKPTEAKQSHANAGIALKVVRFSSASAASATRRKFSSMANWRGNTTMLLRHLMCPFSIWRKECMKYGYMFPM